MSKSNRNDPKRSKASESRYTFYEFGRDFPDDAACLDWLVGFLYPDGIYCPKCEKVTKHHKAKDHPYYSCQFCGHHEHPMRGTIFEGSATSLRLWFHGIFLMSSTRCGISAKQLERELGVTYKTAWRMFNKIRSMLEQDDEPFSGKVEADEAYVGGSDHWKHESKKPKRVGRPKVGHGKTGVFGLAQRGADGKSGKVAAYVIRSAARKELLPHI